jgi:hypothetical protein
MKNSNDSVHRLPRWLWFPDQPIYRSMKPTTTLLCALVCALAGSACAAPALTLSLDPTGVMNSGLDVAEAIHTGTLEALADSDHTPHITERGLAPPPARSRSRPMTVRPRPTRKPISYQSI